MLQVPNPTGYKGIAIAKRKMDEPKTDEPIIYAYARIVQKRRPVVASEVLLGLAEDKDRVTRYIIDDQAGITPFRIEIEIGLSLVWMLLSFSLFRACTIYRPGD